MNTPRKRSQRHILLINQRLMDRLRLASVPLGLLLGVVWWQATVGKIALLRPPWDAIPFVSASVLILIGLFAWIGRNLSYVQARTGHLYVASPLFHLKISYQRLQHVHPIEFQRVNPPAKASWGEKKFLSPFYALTAVEVELKSFPLDPKLLRLFFPKQMFSPSGKALILVVKDGMQLITEIDGYWQHWKQAQRTPTQP
ncbi:MAG: hypothetical protein AB1345_09320 [Chloroflexota bacterium]